VTKHAITGLTKSTSLDGRAYDIACGQIDIGNAATDMTGPMASGVRQADGSIKPEPRIDVQVVADAVVFMAALPLNANVQFMTVMATKMPYIGRGLDSTERKACPHLLRLASFVDVKRLHPPVSLL
jgi:NAD(P)-dependent dehydrogenase (short-subunit alcohol dehydrogenase family)